ncbi:MAG: hypothetical protein CML13_09520 [Puniceicoccaceae bacterium]|nr:hypothetical protein [Puniceicoccaceae bacterium]|tara:strand:- start:1657 stop:2934 length:1278 start_codon:yes stop_codon:yes gene_type:complete
MRNKYFHFYYDFKPVGEGLFATGAISNAWNDNILFNWVYDCGSSDSPAELDREIDAYIRSQNGRGWIDFFIISHLDRDHINGVARIMKRIRVDKIFLPYMPLVERIELALNQPVVSPESLRFAADPAGYLAEVGSDNLGEVIFIVGGESEEYIPPVGSDEPPSPEETDLRKRIKIKKDDTSPDGAADDLKLNDYVRYSYTTATEPASIVGLWEFVFFNETFKEVDASLTETVKKRIQGSIQGDGYFDDAEQLIDDLKDIYENRFFKGNRRNDISLVTYSGPIVTGLLDKNFSDHHFPPPPLAWRLLHSRKTTFTYLGPLSSKPSILYFGDITVKKRRLQKIIKWFGSARWDRITITQIAHHGSVHSWFKSAAIEFKHEYSVYSYGLHNTYKHPGKDVVDDFKTMSATILVNEHQGACCSGMLHFK